MKILKDVSYSDRSEKCRLDACLPDAEGFPVIVYFHGGGLEAGDKRDPYYVEMGEHFAGSGYGFVSVNYRLYPDAKFPDFLADAAEAVAFVKRRVGEWGGSGKLLIAGQSAGAWMALMLCFREDLLGAVGLSADEFEGWIIDSAQTTTHFNVLEKERGMNPLTQRIDEAAPLYYVNGQTAFSRMLLVFYEDDMPCRAEQNQLLYKTVLAFRPEADIETVRLPGGHCAGSTRKDADGTYPFVRTALKWLQR